MSTITKNMINSITDFSNNLTPAQLEHFLNIIDSLNDLLVMANQDTDKAYQLYLNSLADIANEHNQKMSVPTTLSQVTITNNVIQLKHLHYYSGWYLKISTFKPFPLYCSLYTDGGNNCS